MSFPHEKSHRTSFHCHICGKNFKTNCYMRKHLKKSQLTFFGLYSEISTTSTPFGPNLQGTVGGMNLDGKTCLLLD